MQVVREAYLTVRQMDLIGIQDFSSAFDVDMNIRKNCAEDAAKQICAARYFPLYEENDMGSAVAYYFADEQVIVPTGLNALKERIYVEWGSSGLGQRPDPDKTVTRYLPASSKQAAHLHSYLNQFIKSNGVVTEPALSFLSSIDYLLFREGSVWKRYNMLFRHPGKSGGYSLPVWSYSLTGGDEFLDGWAELYQKYGLVPDVKEILVWLHELQKYKTVKLTEAEYEKLKKYCHEIDSLRLGNEYYCLSDRIDDGQCWDVFENGQPDINKVCCVFPDGEWLSARTPSENIVGGGSVSIDFGTKSTVIVVSDQATGSFYTVKFKKGYAEETALYPTELGFYSLGKFLEAYRSKIGRPETCCDTVSIDNSIHGARVFDSASGIFRGMKQWMMDPVSGGAVLRQKDEPDKPIILDGYGSERNSIDPIELYAYYLGLYVNNNRDNKIFMRYRLSFSATCQEQILHKMRESFQRGLTKSLPASIIKSKDMACFSVELTCSEPAAYAVCALACMGMPKYCPKNFFYGIFDFGGGTCDFNYGIWRSEEDEKLHKDIYKILMLGDGGNPFLGGENLLELLAVRVCIEQREWFKKYGYKISRPRCYEGRDENFFSASSEAAYNLRSLVEGLRLRVWENPEDGDTENEEFEMSVSGLLPERGAGRDAPEDLKLSSRLLKREILSRIYDGVTAFFETCYRTLEEQGLKEVPQLCVFLAGNSCRSECVRMAFEKYITEELDQNYIKKVYLCDPMGSPEFRKYIPSGLWDEEQIERMCEKISMLGDLDGKTGVAYGLALYGNQIKIENLSAKDHLGYYLGTSRFFGVELLKGAHGDRLAVGESIPFAACSICNLYYTKMIPKGGELRGAKLIMLDGQNIPMAENMTYFVRANSQTEISIFSVSDSGGEKGSPREELSVDLQSGQFKKITDIGRKG